MYKKRIVNQVYRNNFLEKLDNVNWNSLTRTDNVDELTSKFNDTFQQKCFEYFPMLTINRKNKNIDKPYNTPHIKQLIRKKQALERKYYNQPIKFEKYYNRLRNYINNLIKLTKI